MDAALDIFAAGFAESRAWIFRGSGATSRAADRTNASPARKAARPVAVVDPKTAAHAIGAVVWGAVDHDDLKDILDAYANDERETSATAGRVVQALYSGSFPRLEEPMSFARILEARTAATGSIGPRIMEGLWIGSVISTAVRLPVRHPDQVESLWDSVNLCEMPGPLMSALLAHLRGTVCLAALVDLALGPKRSVPHWLTDSVARGWIDGMKSELAVLAMTHHEAIPDGFRPPPGKELRQDQIIAEHHEGEEIFQALIEQSVAHE